jgi:hypothetical protein
LNVKRDRLRTIFVGEEAINGCEDNMVDWLSSAHDCSQRLMLRE